MSKILAYIKDKSVDKYRTVFSDIGCTYCTLSLKLMDEPPKSTSFWFRDTDHVFNTLDPERWYDIEDYNVFVANIDSLTLVENEDVNHDS